MPPFDDSDKTVADFDLDAFNKEMEEKEKEKVKRKNNKKEKIEEISEIEDFEDFEDFEEIDEVDGIEEIEEIENLNSGFDDFSPDFTSDLDDIDDDLFNEESVISKGLNELDDSSSSSKKRKRKSRSNNPDKTMIATMDELVEQEEEEEEEVQTSEKTEIFSLSDFEEESSSIIVELARIKVIEGASLEEYSIKQEKVVIGRTENNDIMIPNSTISRNHCEISKTESGFKIKDLNSGNGIKVNNKKVSSKTLNSGDIILIGKVKLQFIDLSVEHGGATESTGSVILKVRKPPKKKIIIIAASAVVFLLIVFIAFASYSKKKRLKREREEQIAREYKKKESLKKQVNLFYEQGIGAYKNKEWNSAITYFDRVLKLKPDHSSALDYKKFATSEKENKKLVDDSEDLLLKDDYQAALLKLKKVKETSSYYADSQDRIKIANKKYKEYRFDLAKKSVKDEDYQKALSLLNALLQNYPDFDEATKLKEEVDEKLLTANKKEETPKIVKNTTFDANKYKTKKVRTNPYTKGLNMYGNKQFDQAIKFFQTLSAKDAKTYAKNVQSFKVAYANGVKYLKLKNPSKGISEFNKALSLDGKLGKKMVSDINPKLSILYAIKAKIYFGSKEYAKSYKAAKKATTLSKSDEASNVLTKLEKKARDLYLSAYQKERRSPDSSKRDYSLIMSILPQSNSIHQKAKKRLEKLK